MYRMKRLLALLLSASLSLCNLSFVWAMDPKDNPNKDSELSINQVVQPDLELLSEDEVAGADDLNVETQDEDINETKEISINYWSVDTGKELDIGLTDTISLDALNDFFVSDITSDGKRKEYYELTDNEGNRYYFMGANNVWDASDDFDSSNNPKNNTNTPIKGWKLEDGTLYWQHGKNDGWHAYDDRDSFFFLYKRVKEISINCWDLDTGKKLDFVTPDKLSLDASDSLLVSDITMDGVRKEYFELDDGAGNKYYFISANNVWDATDDFDSSNNPKNNTNTPIKGWKFEDGVFKWLHGKENVWKEYDARDQFFFLYKKVKPLESVPTIDNTEHGVHMYMLDYPYDNTENGIDAVLGGMWDDNDRTEHQNLLSNELGFDGFPVVSANGQSLSNWFTKDPGHEVTKLFRKDKYEADGTFFYSSFANYAYLGDGSEFTVYNSLGSRQKGGICERGGHFFPYNPIVTGKFTGFGNEYGEAGGLLAQDDERYGEAIYQLQPPEDTEKHPTTIDDGTDFNFSMYLETDFVQQKELNGKPVEFKFTGDDDLWVFINDKLVLDIGGVHDPVSGSINFSTGDVTVRDKTDEGALGRIFDTGSDTLNDGEIYTLKMFYMERDDDNGWGGSCLCMSFNLSAVHPVDYHVTHEYYTERIDENGNVTEVLDGRKDGGVYSGVEGDVVSVGSISSDNVFQERVYENVNPNASIVLTEGEDNELVVKYVRSDISKYRVIHNYYTDYHTDGGKKEKHFDGCVSEDLVLANIGSDVDIDLIARRPEYQGAFYDLASVSPAHVLVISEDVSKNEIVLTYERTIATGYRVIHEYYDNVIEHGHVVSRYAGSTEGPLISGNVGDIIFTNDIEEQLSFNGDHYEHVSTDPDTNLELVLNVDKNVIRLRYERDAYTNYHVIHKYYLDDHVDGKTVRVSEGEVYDEPVSGNIADVISVNNISRKDSYHGERYEYVSVGPDRELRLDADASKNEIVLTYVRSLITSYGVTHRYYTEFYTDDGVKRSFDGEYVTDLVPGRISDTISLNDVTRYPEYQGDIYSFEDGSPSVLTLSKDPGANMFYLNYTRNRMTSYRVVHDYYHLQDGKRTLVGSVSGPMISGNIGATIICDDVPRRYGYKGHEYEYTGASPDPSLTLSPNIDANVITLDYVLDIEKPVDPKPEERQTRYRVVHDYYTISGSNPGSDRMFDGRVSESWVEGKPDDTVFVKDIARRYKYHKHTYRSVSVSPKTKLVLSSDESENIIRIVYERKTPVGSVSSDLVDPNGTTPSGPTTSSAGSSPSTGYSSIGGHVYRTGSNTPVYSSIPDTDTPLANKTVGAVRTGDDPLAFWYLICMSLSAAFVVLYYKRKIRS